MVSAVCIFRTMSENSNQNRANQLCCMCCCEGARSGVSGLVT